MEVGLMLAVFGGLVGGPLAMVYALAHPGPVRGRWLVGGIGWLLISVAASAWFVTAFVAAD